MVGALPFRLGDRTAGVLGMNACGANVHAIYRQRPEVLLPPAKPHECSRIALEITVRPEVDVTVRRSRRMGVKF